LPYVVLSCAGLCCVVLCCAESCCLALWPVVLACLLFFQSACPERGPLSQHGECTQTSRFSLREVDEASTGSRAPLLTDEKKRPIGSRAPACRQRMCSIDRLYSTAGGSSVLSQRLAGWCRSAKPTTFAHAWPTKSVWLACRSTRCDLSWCPQT